MNYGYNAKWANFLIQHLKDNTATLEMMEKPTPSNMKLV